MRKIIFEATAVEDLVYWAEKDFRILKKIIFLMNDAAKNPLEGMGIPKPLKYRNSIWSRRINQEHRLVYKVTDDSIIVLSCRFHYEEE